MSREWKSTVCVGWCLVYGKRSELRIGRIHNKNGEYPHFFWIWDIGYGIWSEEQ